MCDCENCNCNDDPTIVQIIGTTGINGLNGWSPLLAVVTDSSRRVLQIIGWTGGTGSPPSSTNQFIGSSGIVSSAALAADIRGATGATGATGDAAWIAVIANVVDGSRVVQQIVDWTGGGGAKPSIVNQFIGPVGIVNTAAAATNIRGATGANGQDLILPNQSGQAGKALFTNGTDPLWSDIPTELPSLAGKANNLLRVKSDESGVEWYSTYNQYKYIASVNSALMSGLTASTWYTLADSQSSPTISLNFTLPNTSKTKRLFITANANVSSSNEDPSKTYAHLAIRDVANNITYVEDIIDFAFRKNPTVQYIGSIVCSGQTISIQFKRDSLYSTPNFLGGTLSVFEIV